MAAGPALPRRSSALLLSTGALTLISKITDRANDSMEQGVSLAPGTFPVGAGASGPPPCPGLLCDTPTSWWGAQAIMCLMGSCKEPWFLALTLGV